MKKILAFRTDRLGDYIITSNILKDKNKLKLSINEIMKSVKNYL